MDNRKPIYIIADDLTGAADAANYFRTDQRKVRVSFSPSTPWMSAHDANVVQVFDSESRVEDEDTAWLRVKSAGEQLVTRVSGEFFLFKKIDSTLRGHVGREIEALLTATGLNTAILAPSFPANGRTVEDGTLFVGGLPVTKTAFAKDPHNPVTSDRLSEIVRQTSRVAVVEIARDIISQGRDAIAKTITEAMTATTNQRTVIVVDAVTDADLHEIAHAIARHPSAVPCGSAGLAKQLVAVWDDVTDGATSSADEVNRDAISEETSHLQVAEGFKTEPIHSCGRVFIAVGSANPVAHEQFDYATTQLDAPVVELKPARLAQAVMHDDELEQAKQKLEQYKERSVVGVALAKDRANRDSNLPGTFQGDLAQLIALALPNAGIDSVRTVGFVATGGDTALALCHALGATAIWPEGEVISGVPWSRIVTEQGEFPLVTKAGGFGDINALKAAVEFLLGGGISPAGKHFEQ